MKYFLNTVDVIGILNIIFKTRVYSSKIGTLNYQKCDTEKRNN